MEFEWDPDKAQSNLQMHTVSFEIAVKVLSDPWRIEEEQFDSDDGMRFNVLGMAEDRVLHVTYTMRGDCYRIISARPAERYERRRYHEG